MCVYVWCKVGGGALGGTQRLFFKCPAFHDLKTEHSMFSREFHEISSASIRRQVSGNFKHSVF